jgi:hypothetical protein
MSYQFIKNPQLAQQPLGGLLVAAALHQDVEHDTGLVYSSPCRRDLENSS